VNIKKNRGVAALVLVVVLAVLGLGGAGAYEWHVAREKNTAKAVVATVTEVQAAKQTSDALAVANAKADAALADLEKAHQAKDQLLAGYITGGKLAIEQDPNPSLQSKIADLMISNALDVSGPATASQVTQFTNIIKELSAANADLVKQNANLKNVNLITTQSLNNVTLENAQVKGNLALAEQAAQTMTVARDTAVKQVVIANGVAASSAKQIQIVQISWEQRVKAWFLGLGLFGIAGVILLFVALPIIAQAFPVLEPAIKAGTSWILGLWHALADKAVAEVKALHAATQTQLAAEQAAHAVTKSTLATTQAHLVTVATTPTVADQLVASMASTANAAAQTPVPLVAPATAPAVVTAAPAAAHPST
jgi:hypothetical protein